MDTFLVHSALQGVDSAQWKLLGMNLSISWIELDTIDNASFLGDIAKKDEVIRLWMSQEPTWTVLVNALSQLSIGLSQKAISQISQEHSKYTNNHIVFTDMQINMQLSRCTSTRENNQKQFLRPS